MREKIREIIREQIPEGVVFDAHTIIEILVGNYSDTYLHGISPNETTEQYHSRISSIIRDTEGVENVIINGEKANEYSMNIRRNFTINRCYKKVK